jgi:hypothetical protein
MSENGVPTDDMPDSQQPPFGGPAYHDRDLDALLSGDPGNTPAPLRLVESTLAALRAAPTGREHSHEAAARTAFRAIVQPGVPWTPPAEHGTTTADTLILPPADRRLSPAGRRPPRAARHRRRRANWDGRRSAIALTSVAAVAVVVIAVAVSGGLPDSIGHVVSFGGSPTSTAASSTGTGQTPGSLEGTGVKRPTPTSAAQRASAARAEVPASAVPASVGPSSTTGPATLCRELFEPSGQQNRMTWQAVLRQLTQLAGGRHKILRYCFRYLSSYFAKDPRSYPMFSFDGAPGGPGDRGSGPGNPESGYSGIVRPGSAPSPG